MHRRLLRRPFSSRQLLVTVVVSLVILLTANIASAASRTIDTDDDLLDPDWQSLPYIADDAEESTSTDPKALPTDMDIQHAWIASDATSLYFRIQMYNEEQALRRDLREAWAQIDCNADGDVNDSVDRWVIYQFHNDDGTGTVVNTIYVRSGTSSFPLATYSDAYGERPTSVDDDDNVEWKVNLLDLPLDCRTDIRVQFHTDNLTDDNDDSTVLGPNFNVPTAVSLHSFSAATSRGSLWGVGLLMLAFGSFSVNVLHRRRREQ